LMVCMQRHDWYILGCDHDGPAGDCDEFYSHDAVQAASILLQMWPKGERKSGDWKGFSWRLHEKQNQDV
jgi:hypothetical protein